MATSIKLNKVQNNKLSTFQYTSTKIKYLHSLGMDRSQIKSELKIIYQWVNGVLNQKVKNPKETF